MSYESEKLAATLKAAREKKGLSQRALSAHAGVPQSHISKIESGAVNRCHTILCKYSTDGMHQYHTPSGSNECCSDASLLCVGMRYRQGVAELACVRVADNPCRMISCTCSKA